MGIFSQNRSVNIAGPVNRAHHLARDLAYWWICLPGLMGGEYWPNVMGLPDNRFTVGRHAQRFTSGVDTYTNAPTWSGTNRPGGFGHLVVPNLTSPVPCFDCGGDVMEAGATWDFTWIVNVNLVSYPGNNDPFMSQFGASNTTFLYMSYNSSTHVPTMLFPAGGGGTLTGTTTLSLEKWWQVGVTWRAADSNRATIYVNGVQDATGTGFTGRSLTATVSNFRIAGDTALGRRISGRIDDARVYKRALSAFEMRDVYQNSLLGYPGLLNRTEATMLPVAAVVADPTTWVPQQSLLLGGGFVGTTYV